MFDMRRPKHSGKCKQCLFFISKIGIIWSSQTILLIINFDQVIKSFLVWNIYFTFFLPVVDSNFLLEYSRVTS